MFKIITVLEQSDFEEHTLGVLNQSLDLLQEKHCVFAV